MSFFSPVTDRSFSARSLYLLVYCLLVLGAITMLAPVLVTLSGSVSGAYDESSVEFIPKFLVNEKALWDRYLDARYGGSADNFKMAWGDAEADFYDPPAAPHGEQTQIVGLWQQFCQERKSLDLRDGGLAFARVNRREAALENRQFTKWLMELYGGDVAALNDALSLEVVNVKGVVPPNQNRLIFPGIRTAFVDVFERYLKQVPVERRLWWDAGGFYRGVYLPRVYGGGIADYNKAHGSRYHSFQEVPFSATAPDQGRQVWFDFVRFILSADYIDLTPEGNRVWQRSGLSKGEFIRSEADASQLSVRSVDVEFATWAKEHGVLDARIPQAVLDRENFLKNKGYWKWRFVWQNFEYVLDEVLFQGNGVRNTFILVVLSVAGALIVNPMAAYALSRYKIRQSYQLMIFFLATIAFPAEVAMIPNFLQIKELGMINTLWALVIPGMVNGFSIFLLKGFFDSLPRELYEAADIDGANEWQVFWGITMNLSKPILAVIALGAFGGAYGAFMFALVLVPDPSMWTLMVWIYQLQQNVGSGIVYASILITAFPTLIVYVCTQHIIMRGIIVPSEK